jgi:serine O-acetyltransferase
MSAAKPSLHVLETQAKQAADEGSWNLDAVVSALRHSQDVTHNIRRPGRIRRTPSREALAQVVADLSAAMFPSHYGQVEIGTENIAYFVGATLDSALNQLVEQVRRSLLLSGDGDLAEEESRQSAVRITRALASRLPSIRNLLVSDLRAAFEGDPAANNYPEILLGYPGMTAIISYRLAHALHELGAPLIARLISGNAHSRTGVDIHPAASIGSGFFIDHGTGVVIGETAVIGERVRLYQAVTLGARHFPTDETGAIIKGDARHPIVEDDVVIYAGATILGRITIGKGSTIGGNVWLTKSVPPNSRIAQAKARAEVSSEQA